MLSNFDLEDYCKKEGWSLVGVFSKDRLPERRVAGAYIINMQDEHAGNGTHWVAFKIFENGKCCYFDSFGVLAPTNVSNFLSLFKPFATNNRTIQDFKSERCGWFCLSFIKYFDNFDINNDVYEAYDDYLNSFSINPKTNDKIVMELLKKY